MPETALAPIDRIGLTDLDIARELSLSVDWVRKDRRHARLLPFFKIGGSVRYNRQRVLEALARLEEGGTALSKRKAATA